jgi:DNA-binding SARP family transcriptional activator/TolB-like protein
MPRWSLQLFGSCALIRDDDDTATLNGLNRFVYSMLAYAALAPQGRVSRERLASAIWEDRSDEQARHSLRQALLSLRRYLGDDADRIIQADGDLLAIIPEALDIDVLQFEVAASATDQASLERACAIYRGELMEGLSLRSDVFQAWLSAERKRLSDRALDAMHRLAALRESHGDHETVIRIARRILTIDPYREMALRKLMLGYQQSGRRAEALLEFQKFRDLLRRDLKASPESETAALFEQIRQNGNGQSSVESEGLGISTVVRDENVEPDLKRADYGIDHSEKPKSGEAEIAPLRTEAPARRRIGRRGWIAIASVVVLATVIVGSAIFWRALIVNPGPVGGVMRAIRAGLLLADQPSIVVLPLEVRGDDPNDIILAEGVVDGITTGLSIVSEMLVIDRHSAMSYQGESIPVEQIADELGVRYCLTGSLQSNGDRVRISLQLVDAAIGSIVWASTLDRELQDIFQLQDQVAFEVITTLQVEITEGEQERISLRYGAPNLQAWLLSGQGIKHLRRLTHYSTLIARDLYERSMKIDPTFAGAYVGLGWTYFLEAQFGWTDDQEYAIARAQQLAQRALEIDPTQARTHSLLGGLYLLTGKLDEAVAAGERAVSLDPNSADEAAFFAYTLTFVGDHDRAIVMAELAMRLSPVHPDWYYWVLGRALRLNEDYDEAVAALLAGNAATGPAIPPRVELAAAYVGMGLRANARQISREILKHEPDFSVRAWVSRMTRADPGAIELEMQLLQQAGLPD